MKYTKEEAKQKWPNVYFYGEGADIGAGAVIREGAVIGAGADIREGADIGAGAVIREGAVIGARVVIGAEAVIGAGAVIREGAVIGAGADIREGAVISTVCAKYICNIMPQKGKIYIRLGCEMHMIEEWEGWVPRHDPEWWEETGKRIYEFLKGEVELYDKKYRK